MTFEKPNNLKARSSDKIAFGVMRNVHTQTPPVQIRLMSSERLRFKRRIIIGILKKGIKNAANVPTQSIKVALLLKLQEVARRQSAYRRRVRC